MRGSVSEGRYSGSVVSEGLLVMYIYADADYWEETRPTQSGKKDLEEDIAQESLLENPHPPGPVNID